MAIRLEGNNDPPFKKHSARMQIGDAGYLSILLSKQNNGMFREMVMNRITIIAEDCKGCRICVKRCPKNCITMSPHLNKNGYPYAEFKSDECTACGFCYYVCPELGTITVHEEKQGPRNE